MPEAWRLWAQSGLAALALGVGLRLSQIGRCKHFKSYHQIKYRTGSSLVAWTLGFWAFTAMARIQSLVSELRSSKPCSFAKINKYRIKIAMMGACRLWGMVGSGLTSKKTDYGSDL